MHNKETPEYTYLAESFKKMEVALDKFSSLTNTLDKHITTLTVQLENNVMRVGAHDTHINNIYTKIDNINTVLYALKDLEMVKNELISLEAEKKEQNLRIISLENSKYYILGVAFAFSIIIPFIFDKLIFK